MSGEEPDEGARMVYYYQALNEVGFKARDLKVDLDRELNVIWQEVQKIITQEKIAADFN